MKKSRLKILILAYAVSPKRGSEYSVAWNHITWMAEYCDLTVLYGSAGEHMGDINEVEFSPVAQGLQNVRFVPVLPTRFTQWLNAANKRGILAYSFYLAYRSWHSQARRSAARLLDEEYFDLVHYLGPIGYREPGYLYLFDIPYVWGPIGGAPNLAAGLAEALPFLSRMKLGFRSVFNWLQLRFSLRVRRALRRADVLLTATTENQDIFRRVLGVNSIYLPENSVIGQPQLNESKFNELHRIRLIWIGKVEARKALKILVDAVARLPEPRHFEVHVVGDGPLTAKLQKKVADTGLSDIFRWHGQIPRAEVQRIIDSSHLHIVTSVSEGNPTTVWEAMSCGVPTLTIDHCGMHDTVRDKSGLKVPVGSYEQVVEGFAQQLVSVLESPDQLKSMANNVLLDAEAFHWRHRPEFWLERYSDAITKFNSGVPRNTTPRKFSL